MNLKRLVRSRNSAKRPLNDCRRIDVRPTTVAIGDQNIELDCLR